MLFKKRSRGGKFIFTVFEILLFEGRSILATTYLLDETHLVVVSAAASQPQPLGLTGLLNYNVKTWINTH